MIRIGLVFTVISVTLMWWAYYEAQIDRRPERWKTMVFTTLCLAQMGHAIAVRSNTQLTIEMSPLSNPFVLVAVIITTVLQLMLIYVEPLRNFFGTHLISPMELPFALALAPCCLSGSRAKKSTAAFEAQW
jgi:Ca2+-transporting ATPase